MNRALIDYVHATLPGVKSGYPDNPAQGKHQQNIVLGYWHFNYWKMEWPERFRRAVMALDIPDNCWW